MLKWPNTADGDVFRSMQSKGYDFTLNYDIDFNVDFNAWPPPIEAIEKLKSIYPNARVYEPDSESNGYALFSINHSLDYDLIITMQKEVSKAMAPFGGICESWGVLSK